MSLYNFKSIPILKKAIIFLVFFLFTLLGFSQSTVVVNAIDDIATKGASVADNGMFQIDLGSTNNTGGDIVVSFAISGTATAGVDYNSLGVTSVTIPNGERTAQIFITPPTQADNDNAGNKRVTLRLTNVNNSAYQIINNSSSTADVIIVDINDCSAGQTAPPILSSFTTKYCSGTQVDLSSFVTRNPPAGTTLRWSTNANPNPNNPNSFLESSIVETGDVYYGFYYGTQGNSSCRSEVVQLPEITFDQAPSLGTPNNNNQRCNRIPFLSFPNVEIDLDETLDDATPGGSWFLEESPSGETTSIGSGNTVNYNGQPAGSYKYIYTPDYSSAPSCNEDSIEVVVFVTDCSPCAAGNRAPVLNEDVPTTFCVVDNTFTQDLSEYTNSTAPNGSELIWSKLSDYNREDAFLDDTNVNQPGTYFAFFLDEDDNCASQALSVTLEFNEKPSVTPEVDNNVLCSEGIMTLSATATAGSQINWYASSTSTEPLEIDTPNFTTPNLTATTSFYVEAVLGSCSSDRVEVVATIVAPPVVEAVSTPIDVCNIEGSEFPEIIDLNSGLTQSSPGTWAITSDPSNTLEIVGGNVVDFEGAPIGNYTFTYTTNTATAPCGETSATITVVVNECVLDSDGDGLEDEYERGIGTNPDDSDSDNDGILDAVEVGDDLDNPLDTDGDGIIDALESNVLDADSDGVVDQLDPANENPCIPDNTAGACDTDGDGITDGDEIANGTDEFDPCDPNETPDCAAGLIDLAITKAVAPEFPSIGDVVEFTITLTNISAVVVNTVSVEEIFTPESGFEYISNVASAGTYSPLLGTWDIQEVEENGIHTLRILARVLETGSYMNTVEITNSFPADYNSSNDIATVAVEIGSIDLAITKTVDVEQPFLDEIVEFTITISNLSDELVTSISVSEVFSEERGFEFISSVASAGTYDSDLGVWSIPEITANGEHALQILARVLRDGDYTNTVEITDSSPRDNNNDNNIATIVVGVAKPSVDECGFLFNQFSPNRDGINDKLTINCIENYPNNILEIYDRYGNQVYRAVTYDNSWDGSGRNGITPKGTYYYILDLGDGSPITKGWIQIIR